MVRHQRFSNTIQKSPEDSLTSYCTSTINGYITIERETFKGDELKRLYNNLVETYELSNGTLNIVDSYNYRTLWHDTLRVEGESLLGEAEGLTSDFSTLSQTRRLHLSAKTVWINIIRHAMAESAYIHLQLRQVILR